MVATTRITHHGNHRPIHTGIAGSGRHRQHVGIDGIAQEPFAKFASKGLAHGVTIATGLHRGLGGRLVHPSGFQNKTNLFQRHLQSEIIDQAKVEGDLLLLVLLLISGSRILTVKHFAVSCDVAKMSVRMADHHPALVITPMADHLDIEFIHLLLQGNRDALSLHHGLALSQSLGAEIFQHLQTVGRATDQRAQGDSDGKAHHPRARNAYTHGILQDIRTQIDLYPLRLPTQHLRCFRRSQGHGDRFRAANRRDHLPVDQRNDLLLD